jgi:vacuolar-type H+-ATPase subunit H
MTIYDQEQKILISADKQVRLWAEARAKAAIAEAKARAESVTTTAEARAKELIAEHYRRMQELACRTRSMASTLTRSDWENIVTEQTDKPLPLQVDPALFREAVSVRAYYKAEQRDFWPGHETGDWLEAERELLSIGGYYTSPSRHNEKQ